MTAHGNKLIHEKSPYLLQHAHNPVRWRPWGEEAFAEAREQDKPIFLSIGYATCHWCHVMERESFEDVDTARLINRHFIPVKVDREERPDIDTVYMNVCQTMTGSGGWPLTVFMTADRAPFFSATYIPRDSSFGRMGLKELIPKVHELWTQRRDDVLASAQSILARVRSMQDSESEAGFQPGREQMDRAVEELRRRFDTTFHGFGTAPKFPSPHVLMFLTRYSMLFGERTSLDMAVKTLGTMRQGGIFDHLGYGFHRYSTDRVWLLPHFEKMLYDQAMLMLAYTEAWIATGNDAHQLVCREIAEYLFRDMGAAEGPFHSAEDADSQGEEGLFYLFGLDEIRSLLGEKADLATFLFGLRANGNYRDEATGDTTGLNILHLPQQLDDAARSMDMSGEELNHELAGLRETLLAAREGRERPLLDDKILTDWNGLAIAALARAGAVFGEPTFLERSRQAAEFFLERMLVEQDGVLRLLHRYRQEEAAIDGFLDDYAYFTWALLELHQAGVSGPYLETARRLTSTLFSHFASNSGLFHIAPKDGDPLPLKPLESFDMAIPSGNSVTLHNLFTLSRLTGSKIYAERARQLLTGLAPELKRAPSGLTFVLYALCRSMAQ